MSPNRDKSFFTPIVLGYAVFGVLLLFSIQFYLERTCYADIAFQTFFIINTKNVFYQLDRFGALFIQLFPAAAVWLKLPLQYVLLSYSVALVLQNIFFFWLLHKVLKQKEVALVLVLFNVLLVSESFYWATNEVKQGFSFSILFAGVIRALPVEQFNGWKKGGILLLYVAILIIAVFLHPLVVIAVAFVLGYNAIHSHKFFSQTLLTGFGMVAAILFVKYFLLPVATYDAEQLSLRKNFIDYFPHYFDIPSFGRFVGYCTEDWYLYVAIFLGVVASYLWKKAWQMLGWQLAFSLGYLMLVNVTHMYPEKPFIECYYQALAIFVLFPLVMEIFPGIKTRGVLVLMLIICVLRLNFIYHTHHKYTKRLNLVQQILSEHEGKFIILQDDYPWQPGIMTWGIAYESALLTAMQSPDSCRSFAVLRDTTMLSSESEVFYSVFGKIHYAGMNQDYFRPTPGPYRVLTREVLNTPIPK